MKAVLMLALKFYSPKNSAKKTMYKGKLTVANDKMANASGSFQNCMRARVLASSQNAKSQVEPNQCG